VADSLLNCRTRLLFPNKPDKLKQLRYLYLYLTRWVRANVTRVQFIILLAVATGLIAGLAAVLLKLMVHELQQFLANRYRFSFFYLLFPAVGILLTACVIHYFFEGKMEKGLAMVLKNIATRSSYIGSRHTYMHMITSCLTVGFGGSAGLEAPIVATGSAIGSNVGRVNYMIYRERTLLIACGAAAGISSVFNAPIAGVIFAIEVLLTETIVSYFIPLIIASVTGVLCSKIILNETILFNFVLKESFDYHNVPFYILLGIGGGFISLYYARVFRGTEHNLDGMKFSFWKRALIAGGLLTFLYFLFPPLFGEGYESVKNLAYGNPEGLTRNSFILNAFPESWELLVFTGLIVLMKPIAAGITLGGGGYGGNFAPSLFTGAFWGFFFSKAVNTTGWLKLPENNFTLTGMAAILSGVMYCPLTAIFLIAEITNGYELIIPLMLVSSLSFFIVKQYQPFSMDIRDLAKSGKVFTHEKEKNILQSLELPAVTDTGFYRISETTTLAEVRNKLENSEQPIVVVTSEEGELLGWVGWKQVSSAFRDQALGLLAGDIAEKPTITIPETASVVEVMRVYENHKNTILPVVNGERKFVGIVSTQLLLEKYREVLKDHRDLYTD